MTAPVSEIDELRCLLAEATIRLRLVEDERAVLGVLYSYHHTLGNHDRDGWLNCFASDAVLLATGPDGSQIYEVRGQAALRQWYDRRARQWPAGSEGHAYVNPRVRIDGDRADASGFFITMSMGEGALVLRSTGEYSDHLVRCSDKAWRIIERRTRIRLTNRQSFVS